MIVRASTLRPAKQAVFFANKQIVDAGMAVLHQAIVRKFPVFVAVRPEPIAAVIAPLIGIAHGNPVFGECPKLLDQPVFTLAYPLAGQKGLGLLPVGDEMRSVAPFRVQCIGLGYFGRISAVPAILGQS